MITSGVSKPIADRLGDVLPVARATTPTTLAGRPQIGSILQGRSERFLAGVPGSLEEPLRPFLALDLHLSQESTCRLKPWVAEHILQQSLEGPEHRVRAALCFGGGT